MFQMEYGFTLKKSGKFKIDPPQSKACGFPRTKHDLSNNFYFAGALVRDFLLKGDN